MGRMSIGRSSHGMMKVNTSKYHPPADRLKSAIFYAEVSEGFKELVLKTSDSARGRGFESHPQRHNNFTRSVESVYVVKLLSGAFLVIGSVTWSLTMLQYEATRFKTEREAVVAGRNLLGGRPFSAVRV